MARAPTTSDVFNAIAEPQRRAILELLREEELSVNEISAALGLKQPQTSKHLRVLREVDLLQVRSEGKRRLYRLDGDKLKPVYDWVAAFEQLWNARLDRLDAYLARLQGEEQAGRGEEAGDAKG